MANKKSEIRVYSSFTEVREDVEATAPFYVYLPQDVYNQILPGSLNLEKVKVLSINSVLKENNLEGKTLFVHKENEVLQVKVIRGRDLLVQDLNTKRFYHVNRNELEFVEVPEETGTEITFVVEKGGDAVLSYLMHGIRWQPRYTFNIENDKHEFQGWADINNNTQREYTIDRTELFGGDVSMSGGGRPVAYQMKAFARGAAAPNIQSEGEKAGLYMYVIADKYTLAPLSTFSLPFVSPTITLTRVATLNSYFHGANNKGKFARVYKISSSDFLPAGSVTVREDGRVVGQANIPDLTANESHDLNVGNDPDVSYDRQVKTLHVNNDESKYQVLVKISNNKTREINFEYVENFGQRNEITQTDPQLKIENNTLKHTAVLPAKGNTSIKYTVTLFHK